MLVRIVVAISSLCLVAVAAWVLHDVLAKENDSFLRWRDPAITTPGRTLYTTHCAGCHGMPDGSMSPAATASGTPTPPHDRSGHTWQHPDYALFQLIRDGVAVANCVPVDTDLMPKFRGTVSDSELVAILSYIKSTWPEDIRRSHDQVNRMYGPYNRAVGELIGAAPGDRG